MFGIKGVGTRTARAFNYTPRYWDREAEEREERKRQILGDKYESGEYVPGTMIRDGRLRRMQHADRTHSKARTPLIRAAIFIILVCGVLYIMTNLFGLLA